MKEFEDHYCSDYLERDTQCRLKKICEPKGAIRTGRHDRIFQISEENHRGWSLSDRQFSFSGERSRERKYGMKA